MVAAAVAIAGLLGWLARMGWAASKVEVRQKQNKAAAPGENPEFTAIDILPQPNEVMVKSRSGERSAPR